MWGGSAKVTGQLDTVIYMKPTENLEPKFRFDAPLFSKTV